MKTNIQLPESRRSRLEQMAVGVCAAIHGKVIER